MADLRSCWSAPIRGAKNEVVGNFTLFFAQQALLERWSMALVSELANAAALLIERMRAEQALMMSEERLRSLVEGSIQGRYVHRRVKPLFSNQMFAQMVGLLNRRSVLRLQSHDYKT